MERTKPLIFYVFFICTTFQKEKWCQHCSSCFLSGKSEKRLRRKKNTVKYCFRRCLVQNCLQIRKLAVNWQRGAVHCATLGTILVASIAYCMRLNGIQVFSAPHYRHKQLTSNYRVFFFINYTEIDLSYSIICRNIS